MKFYHWLLMVASITLLIEAIILIPRALDSPKTMTTAVDTSTPCPAGEYLMMQRPFGKNDGFSYFAELPELEHLGDTSDQPTRSPMIICEGRIVLGPPHTDHIDIVELGKGRFSHWGSYVRFSTSDNTDPNENGHAYLFVKPAKASSRWLR